MPGAQKKSKEIRWNLAWRKRERQLARILAILFYRLASYTLWQVDSGIRHPGVEKWACHKVLAAHHFDRTGIFFLILPYIPMGIQKTAIMGYAMSIKSYQD